MIATFVPSSESAVISACVCLVMSELCLLHLCLLIIQL